MSKLKTWIGLTFVGGDWAGHYVVNTCRVELRAEQTCFRLRIGLTRYYSRCMSGVRLRSGKRTGKAGIVELKPKEKSKVTKEESAMNDAILEELKSLRSDLTKQMQIISDELATFKNTTDARLAKIENVISKIDEIDQLKPKVEKLEEDVGCLKESVNTT